MLHIVRLSQANSEVGRKRRKGRSASSNPRRNKIKTTDIKRDRSACTEKDGSKLNDYKKHQYVAGRGILATMVPIIKKPLVQIEKFLAKRFKHGVINEMCCICYDPAQVRHCGVYLCFSCREFLDENAFRQDRVISILYIQALFSGF